MQEEAGIIVGDWILIVIGVICILVGFRYFTGRAKRLTNNAFDILFPESNPKLPPLVGKVIGLATMAMGIVFTIIGFRSL